MLRALRRTTRSCPSDPSDLTFSDVYDSPAMRAASADGGAEGFSSGLAAAMVGTASAATKILTKSATGDLPTSLRLLAGASCPNINRCPAEREVTNAFLSPLASEVVQQALT